MISIDGDLQRRVLARFDWRAADLIHRWEDNAPVRRIVYSMMSVSSMPASSLTSQKPSALWLQ
ncbi:hypothetical protein ACFFX0_28510 [Citricoccus parietis]|uniref:Uncharacterized protein n=1 Tax=Citricoccus parietis TaxID=592307 RepID=A0ABV5FSN8_9MICC